MSTAGLRVTDAFLYPIKGAAGISVPSLRMDAVGPVGDRRWMLVDEEGVFLSQRSTPEMALLRTSLRGDGVIEVSHPEAPGGAPVRLPFTPADGEILRVRIWMDEVDAIAAHADADRWFSDILGRRCRAVHLPEWSPRAVDPDRVPGARVAFADGFPLLLVTRESLEELNRRLTEPLPMNRFRPNLVVGGADGAHDEDRWQRLRIGDNEFLGVKPCARCTVTTVDQSSGERGSEPLTTLATYRKRNGKVYFGQNLVQTGPGEVSVGDGVEVLERHEPRY